MNHLSRHACQMMPWLLAFYAVASLVHFTHNAEYLAQYPNLPASWTRADVYLAWCGVTTVGLSGYLLYRVGYRLVGLTVLLIYSGLGFDGLLHYTRAPIGHHSPAMNFTICSQFSRPLIGPRRSPSLACTSGMAGTQTWVSRFSYQPA